ncbi:MAG: YDG domain-containing protein [Rubrivivax sp.]
MTMNRARSARQSRQAPRGGQLRPLVQALAAALAATAGLAGAQALPAGGVAVQGQASIATQGNRMTVRTTDQAVLNWQSFSIGPAQTVRFEQPSASSQVLNRVLGRDPSLIQGQLQSNGGVWLLNPYGVMFGAGARVDVASLVVSTLNISDADWQARRFSLFGGHEAGTLVNQGEIRTTLGGRVLLLGGAGGVHNEGLIEAPGGQVALAAGASIDLADSHAPGVAVRVTAPVGQALNLGRVLAPGGTIDLSAAMVNQQGIVRADRLDAGPAGEVRLTASASLELGAGSQTSADGLQGGRIVAQGGTTLVAGQVQADGSRGTGGDVRLLGQQVGLLDGARVSASGESGGGQVLVGGGLQGRDPSVPNARALYMGPGASIRADAGTSGDGGRVVLWSDEATRVYGAISARGGRDSGDGGFVETSGGWLDARPLSIRTDAPRGRAGQWLLDPNDILITDEGSDTHITGGPNFRSTNDSAVVSTSTLADALAAGTSVTVTTANGGANSEPGDIRMQGTLSVEPSSPATLTLNATRHISLEGASIFSEGPLNVNLSAGHGGSGGILIDSSTIGIGGSLTLGGTATACGAAGCATFPAATGTTDAGRGFGVLVQNSSLSADRIRIRGASAVDNQTHGGVRIANSASLLASQIDIAGWTGSPADFSQYGVDINGSLAAVDRVVLDGTARVSGSGGSESTSMGVRLSSSSSVLVGPTAVNSSSGTATAASAGDRGARRALAADPSRYLRVTGKSDPRSGLSDESVSISGSVWVTDKAGITLTGDGGSLFLGSNSFDSSDAGNLLIGGNSLLVWRTDDLLLPTAEPVRLTNAKGVAIQGSMFGSPSDFSIDSPNGTVEIADSFLSPSINIGSSPFSSRSAAFEMGLFGSSAQIDAARVTIRADRIELGPVASIVTSGTGDAIVLAGLSGNASTVLIDGSSLIPVNGRWLIYATDPTDTAHFNAGSLSRDFTQYDATYPGTKPLGSGNGVLFSLAPTILITGTAQGSTTKVYDGTTSTSATLDEPGFTGLLPGDFLSVAPDLGPLRFASPDAADRVALVASVRGTPVVFDSNDQPVYGYRFTGRGPDLYGTIKPRLLTVGGLDNLDKVYDGTRAVPLSNATLTGLLEGQSLTLLPGTVAFDTPDAGRNKPVTGVFELADGPGGLASNYRLDLPSPFSTTATIAPRTLTLAGAAVLDKVYDGTTAATLTGGTLSGLVGQQTLTLATGAATFDTKDAGTGKPVQATVVLGDGTNGGLASNYSLGSGGVLSLTGNILQRPLSIAGLTVSDKVYDGSTQASAVLNGVSGVLPGETIGVAVDARFADPNVGTAKPVSTQLLLSDGANGRAANYVYAGAGFQATASITPRPVTVAGVTANDKPYDGTTAATLSAGTITGLVPGETLTLGGTAAFDTKAVGTGKTVRGSIVLADGNARATNYLLTNGGSFDGRASILPRALAVTGATVGSKAYDGDATTSASGFTLSGVLPGENVSVSGGSGRFDDPDAGVNKGVTATATGLTGADAGNYTLAQPSVRTRGSITPATLRLVADPATSTVGYPLPLLTGAVAGFVGADSQASATSGTLRFDTTATTQSPAGTYAVVGSGLSARNYVFTQAPGNATALSLVPLSTSKIGEPTSTAPGVPALLAGIQPASVVSSVQAHRVFDALPALQSAPPNVVFRPFDLDASSEQDVARLLAARDRYKKTVFADAIRDLENNPGAADAPACQTVEQALSGSCLVTEVLKPALRERVQIEFRPQPVPPAPTAVAAAPVPPAPAPVAPAPLQRRPRRPRPPRRRRWWWPSRRRRPGRRWPPSRCSACRRRVRCAPPPCRRSSASGRC